MSSAARTGRKRITLECDMGAGREVFVAGTFNNWDPVRKRMKAIDGNGSYRAILVLPPGRHEYKFVVDGEWRIDDANPEWAPNDCGSLNSVVTVG